MLSHVQAWHDADPDRRFTSALQAMARACAGTDAVSLETAARSLLSVLSRHPLTYSPAVAETATRLRRVLDAGPLADSWRQPPGTSGYPTDLPLAAARQALAVATPGQTAGWRG